MESAMKRREGNTYPVVPLQKHLISFPLAPKSKELTFKLSLLRGLHIILLLLLLLHQLLLSKSLSLCLPSLHFFKLPGLVRLLLKSSTLFRLPGCR
jgi:hypothetical protein